MKWERLCLWCEHFHIDAGHAREPGWSEVTPSIPSTQLSFSCQRGHWYINNDCHDLTEEEYRRCLLTAANCSEFNMLDDILRLIAQNTGET